MMWNMTIGAISTAPSMRMTKLTTVGAVFRLLPRESLLPGERSVAKRVRPAPLSPLG
jgi:hypothetical protein